ncbi:MAG: hypothetical protein WBM81_09360 [Sedimenticolaceae bacterium]
MNHEAASAELLSRLYLHAVIPALADLVTHDDAARLAVGRGAWRVRLRNLRGDHVTVDFDGRRLVVDPNSRASALTLLFLSDRHIVSTFQGQAFPPPLPAGGQWHLPKLGAFIRLTKRLTEVMDEPSANASCRTRLLFGGLLSKALVELADHQDSARRELRRFEPFMTEFRVGTDYASWFGCVDGRFTGGVGRAPHKPDTVIGFRDATIASAAAGGSLDQLAAVGTGDIEVHGRIPLADTLDLLLDRIGSYLK